MAVEEELVVAAGPTTVTVESGAFTVSSTVGQVIRKHTVSILQFIPVCLMPLMHLRKIKWLVIW
jgi:hypothetical protein